jgi:hypothetical protein
MPTNSCTMRAEESRRTGYKADTLSHTERDETTLGDRQEVMRNEERGIQAVHQTVFSQKAGGWRLSPALQK